MSASPSQLFFLGENKMHEISFDQSTYKYQAAGELFAQAAVLFEEANNPERAGDSYQMHFECMKRLERMQDAVDSALAAARLFWKCQHPLVKKCYECFKAAATTAREDKRPVQALKALLEGAGCLEKCGAYRYAVEFRREAANDYRILGNDTERLGQEELVSEDLVLLESWAEAAVHFQTEFERRTKEATRITALNEGLFAVLCYLAIPETMFARKTNERNGTVNASWTGSEQSKFVKALFLVLVQKHYNQLEQVGLKWGEEHDLGSDEMFRKIILGVAKAFADRQSA
jgi:hypothetical protein